MVRHCGVVKVLTTIPNMGTNKVQRGPVSQRVAENIRALRGERRLTLDDLARRLVELGRPILKSGLSKVESGERRVDVDDLMALALALNATPNRLLLEAAADDELTQLTDNPTLLCSRIQAWAWACGEAYWGAGDHPSTLFDGIPFYEFQTMTHPHDVPARLSADEWRKLEPWQRKLDDLQSEMESAGFDFRALVPDRVTYETHDEGHTHG